MTARRHYPQQDEGEEPSINLTPLIDVVFVVLIVFILVAPMLEVDKVSLAPGATHEEVSALDSQHPISLQVRADNTIYLNGQKVLVDHLPILLTDARRQHPTTKPQLIPDEKASFGTYQQVKNAAEIAGFDELEVVLKPG